MVSKKVLVACECSQVVTTAFRAVGADAFSCDIADYYGGHPEWHIKGDVLNVLYEGWDLVIAHPPCTYLSLVSAVALSRDESRWEKMREARDFFYKFVELGTTGLPVCIENPIPLKVARLPRYTQLVCPSQYGHKFTKRTCLWLYNLPPLLPMRGYYVDAKSWVLHCASNGKRRSRFWEGIAEAMAEQWFPLI